MSGFLAVSYLFSPLLLGLTAHGFCIKFDWLGFLTKPIDQGKTFRGKRLFGENKSFRGLVANGVGTAFGVFLQVVVFHGFATVRQIELLNYSKPTVIPIGFLLGVAAMLGELPNSFIKRQLDIAPGATASGPTNILFYIVDQVDYLLGTWPILAIFMDVTILRIIYSAIFLFVTHQIISLLGFWLGMRKTAR